MKINANMAAAYTIANLNKANNSASQAMKRLSSGLKLNSAKDNPSAYGISHKLDAQVRGLSQANRNVMDGISLVQTAEGALNEVSAMLTRLKELTVQKASGTYDATDKTAMDAEIKSLVEGINSIKKDTNFNGINIFDKTGETNNITLQIGANSNETMSIEVDKTNVDEMIHLLVPDATNIQDNDIQNIHTKNIDEAIAKTNEIRGYLGACQNRLEHTSNNLSTAEENTTYSLSRIKDADMAEEMTNYTQYNVLTQSGIAMLAQANQRPQQVLQLLNS